MTKAPAPTKGVKPSMAGVPGMLLDEAPSDILFGERKNARMSPYDPLLLQLQKAGAGKFLKFDDLRARVSVVARAKKLGIKVMFGEQGQTLWVTLAKVEMQTGGVTEPQSKPPFVSDEDLVLRAVGLGKDLPGLISTWARGNGNPDLGIGRVDGVLNMLARQKKVKLKKQSPSDPQERWTLA